MKKIKLISAIFLAITSVSVSAADDSTVIHVTPQMLSAQAGIPLDWKVSHKQYDFDIENETDSVISIAVKVLSQSYTQNVKLLLSTGGGDCGLMVLAPQQYVVCHIMPQGHLELDYNLFPAPQVEPKEYILGTFTLGKMDSKLY